MLTSSAREQAHGFNGLSSPLSKRSSAFLCSSRSDLESISHCLSKEARTPGTTWGPQTTAHLRGADYCSPEGTGDPAWRLCWRQCRPRIKQARLDVQWEEIEVHKRFTFGESAKVK